MNYQELNKILTACLVVAPKKDFRYYLNSVHIKQDERGCTIEATDGHSLVQFKTPYLIQGKLEFDVILDIVQVKLLNDKIKAMNYHKTNLNEVEILDITSSSIQLNISDCDLIEGNYPDTNRVIWKDSKPLDTIGIDARYLANIPKVSKPFASKQALPVRLEFKDSMSSVKITFETGIDRLEVLMLIMPCRL